jgi:hypothetical protein
MIDPSKLKPGTLLTLNEKVYRISRSDDKFVYEKFTPVPGMLATFLEYSEGIEPIVYGGTLDNGSYYLLKVKVLVDTQKFWIAISFNQKHISDLPDDMLEQIRKTKMFDIVE